MREINSETGHIGAIEGGWGALNFNKRKPNKPLTLTGFMFASPDLMPLAMNLPIPLTGSATRSNR